jgi:cyanophycinase
MLAPVTVSGDGWTYWCYGNGCQSHVNDLTTGAAQASAASSLGFQLEGGGTDIEEAFTWSTDLAAGGDWLCIRATGTDAYNDWVYNLSQTPPHAPLNTAATVLVNSTVGANDPFVVAAIKQASVLFFSGGDQSMYTGLYNNTDLLNAVQSHIGDKHQPLGGTSAGLHIQGEFIYTAELAGITSQQALTNPYSEEMTLGRNFIHNPLLASVITDSHFCVRDRMGRSVAFAARLLQVLAAHA